MLGWLQRQLMYFPTRELEATPAAISLAYESVEMRTDDGVRIHGWWVPHETARATALFFHGNAGNISHRLDTLAILHELSIATLIIDYRGFGQSEGSPDEHGTYADARAALAWLEERPGIDPARIFYFGRSLGGGVATELAVGTPPAALILESTFTSVPDLAAELYPLPLIGRLTRIGYDNLSRLAKISAPLLVVHSPQDEIIPFSMGRRLFEGAEEPKTFLEIRGSHGDGFYLTGPPYLAGLDRFLTGVFGPAA